MPVEERKDGLQIEHIPGFHQRWWKAKRVAWVIWLLILSASVAGLLGGGRLSEKIQQSQNGTFAVDYQRLSRHQRTAELKVSLDAGSTGEEFALRFNRAYMASVEVVDIEPRPDKERAAGVYYEYAFLRTEPAKGTEVVFRVKARKMGKCLIEINLNGKDGVAVQQFVYP